MARQLRIEYEGALYHVTSRGNGGGDVFNGDTGKELFLSILVDMKKRYNLIIHSWCLMDNHYHLLLETPWANLSDSMRQINGIYTQRFNKMAGRRGHLFQGRFKAIICDKDSYFLTLVRYIPQNPLRAKMIDDPFEYPWSSLKETLSNTTKEKKITNSGLILSYFSNDTRKAKRLFADYIYAGKDENLWDNLKGDIILGNDEFVARIERLIVGEKQSPEIPKRQRYATRLTLSEIFEDVSSKAMRNKKILEAHIKYGYRITDIANHLGVHYSRVSHILKEESV